MGNNSEKPNSFTKDERIYLTALAYTCLKFDTKQDIFDFNQEVMANEKRLRENYPYPPKALRCVDYNTPLP